MTAKIKLNAASGGGSFSLQAPSSSSNNRVFTLPDVADTTMATVNGITMVDVWKLTTDFSGNVNPLSSNLVRDTTYSAGVFGTGMSVSSGYWTFPATGIYLVHLHLEAYFPSNTNPRLMARIYVTVGGGSYSFVANGNSHAKDGGYYGGSDAFYLFDVTNTSTHKAKFLLYSSGTSNVITIVGDSSTNKTYASFIRLADT